MDKHAGKPKQPCCPYSLSKEELALNGGITISTSCPFERTGTSSIDMSTIPS